MTSSERWIFRLYNALILLAAPAIFLIVALRWRRRVFSRGFQRWPERWGKLAPEKIKRFSAGPWWWVHAVSMGEVKAIESFLRRAPREAQVKILLSVVTPEALAWCVENQVADEIVAAPIDLPWVVRRVFRAVRPSLFVSVESEFWPNLLREAKRSGARVALINGRMSEHSFKNYRLIPFAMKALWNCIDLWAVRQDQDGGRFIALGVPRDRLQVTGNLKYDLSVSQAQGNRRAARRTAGPVLVLGSTREGEENQLIPVLERLRQRWPQLQVIWAPRHIDRIGELESLFRSQGLAASRKSYLSMNGNGTHAPALNILWDSMGDLVDAYREADVAVIGGSFVPKGGQNPIEPAAMRIPVVFGPSMDNFHGVADSLVQAGGAKQVSLDELEACLQALLDDPDARRTMGECARRAVENEQGATDRTLKLLEKLTHA